MATPQRWFYELGGEQKGPATVEELRALAQAKTITRDTRVTPEGSSHGFSAAHLHAVFPDGGGVKWLIPVGRSAWAILAGYLGLLSLIPFVGFAAMIVCVIAALDLRAHPEKSGWGRVIFALVMSVPLSILYTYLYLAKA